MAHRVPITVRLDSFEGPLDLLLFLIQSHELDISKVSISEITDQYLAYVRLMQELNFDFASEFLVMAATLLHWKSKAILPQEGNADANAQDEDGALSQEDLIRQLGLDQNVSGKELSLGIDLAAAAHFDDLLGRHEDLLELVGKTLLTGLFLDRFSDLLLEVRVRVNDVPAGNHGFSRSPAVSDRRS